jgi:cytochrome d ubiquinol oxidase subunit I
VKGLDEFPEDLWPTNIEILYYAFHIMAGLGTIFIVIMLAASVQLFRGRLAQTRWLLWILMLAFPFPFIANIVGWITAELGRQPWIVYGMMRTQDASSTSVHGGSATFTLIGFMGLYFVLGVLYLFLVGREVAHGPSHPQQPAH